jgi:hypothetical protein
MSRLSSNQISPGGPLGRAKGAMSKFFKEDLPLKVKKP